MPPSAKRLPTARIRSNGGSTCRKSGSCNIRSPARAISREESSDSKDVRRESYTLPKDSTVAVTVDRTTKPAVVSLTIEPNQDALRPHYPLRVDALLGRDLRFSERRKEGK